MVTISLNYQMHLNTSDFRDQQFFTGQIINVSKYECLSKN